MSKVDLKRLMYTGADIVEELVKNNNKKYKDSNINFKFLGKRKEKEDVFFGLIEIVDSDFKIKFASEDKQKISLNYQGCYKNKVCYPSKMKNIVIKYDKKSISSVKID